MFQRWLITLVLSFLFTTGMAQVQLISGLGQEHIQDLAKDPAGNVYVLGSFENNLLIGGEEIQSNGGSDMFLAKYDDNLSLQWVKSWGGKLDETAGQIVVTPTGSLMMTAHYEGPWVIEGRKLQALGKQHVTLLTLQPSGEVIHVAQLPGEGTFTSQALATNMEGDRFLALQYEGVMQVNGVRFAAPLGQPEVLLLKGTSSKEWDWARTFTGADREGNAQLATDPSGGVFIALTFSDRLDVGDESLTADGNSDFFLGHYSSAGLLNWYNRSWGAGHDRAHAITTDPTGAVYVTGHFSQQIRIGGLEAASASGNDMFIAKWNAAGKEEWLRVGSGGMGPDAGYAISWNDDMLWVTGKYAEGITFDTYSLEGADDTEMFLATYASNGVMNGLIRAGGNGMDKGKAVQLLPKDRVLLVGVFEGKTNVGGLPIESSDDQDAFLWLFDHE